MKASYTYSWGMPLKKFKVIQKECLDLFNLLVDKEELDKEDWQDLESFKDESGYFPIAYTLNDLESYRLLKSLSKSEKSSHLFNREDYYLQPNPFKIRK